MPPKKSSSGAVGQISPSTVALRPTTSLTNQERKLAKEMRASGKSFDEIGKRIGKETNEVEKSLSTIRTKQNNPTRYTLNIHKDAYSEIEKLRKDGEPVWKTVNRMLGINEENN